MAAMRQHLRLAVRDAVASLGALWAIAYFLGRVLGIRNHTTAALALLLVVLGTATLSRLAVAVATSIAAMLILNYFFLPPIGTFRIAEAHNWVALASFVLAAVVGSQLSSAAQTRAREAIESRREMTRLFDLSRDILLTTDRDDALPALARYVALRFDLDAVAIGVPHSAGWTIHQGGVRDMQLREADLQKAFAEVGGALEYDARQPTYGDIAQLRDEDRQKSVTLVPVRLGTRAVGLLATDSGRVAVGTLDAVGGVVAIAIERTVLLAERQRAEILEQRAELTSALLTSLGHDLRTPVTAVRLAVANLQDSQLSEDERRKQAQLAQHELERLTRLLQDILDMARIEAAGIAAERQWVTPADIVDAALAHGGPLLSSRQLNVSADARYVIQVDPRLTSNALAHIVENAALYSPGDTPIEISGDIANDGLRLSVRDHGPGLKPEELDRLFDKFYRGASARAVAGGSGMGLAITRGLLAAEGGRVWGENMPDGGARFTIVVPGERRPAPAEDDT